MSDNIRIIQTNEADAATLTSSDFVGSLPETNLQIEGRARVARTANATGPKVINGEWSAPRIISAAVLYNHNLTSQATWRVQGWGGAAQSGTMVLDSGTVDAVEAYGWGSFAWGLIPWGSGVFEGWDYAFSTLWFTPVAVRSWRVTLTDAANADGYLQAKRLLLGAYFSPTVNPEYGLGMRWADDTENTRTEAGSLRSYQKAKYRKLSFDLSTLSENESADLLDIARRVGKHQEIFVSVFPNAGGRTERNYSMLGKFEDTPDNNLVFWQTLAQKLIINEA